MAPIWCHRGAILNHWDSFLVSPSFYIFIFYWAAHTCAGNSSMVARYLPRGGHSRIAYIYCRAGAALRDGPIYCLRGIFFCAFFHRRLSPNIEVGSLWPPIGIKAFNPFQVPLLNTIVLISSGVRVTWAHHALIGGNFSQTKQGLIITVLLGVYFTILQGLEYYEARFTFADSVYGSTFFIATGFHGLHVLVGTLFLIVTLARHRWYEFSATHHFGFEAAA